MDNKNGSLTHSGTGESEIMLKSTSAMKQLVFFKNQKWGLIISIDIIGDAYLSDFTLQIILVKNNKLLIQNARIS